MPRVSTPFNGAAVKQHERRFVEGPLKDAYMAKESWWIQPTRNDFIVRRDAELPRMMKAPAMNATAESGSTSRQTFMQRKVTSMLDRVKGGSE
jgi:hypothetical protein